MEIGSIWNGWTVEKLIGEGSFGKVYKITRKEFGHTYESALKVIKIPQTQAEVETIRNDGMSDESIAAYFESLVEDIVDEFALMSKLRGYTNIVSYEDHSVVPQKDGIGWDIFIRMELLTPMFQYLRNNTLSVRNVIMLGIDICQALEICQKFNIIHRDIKPENIFVSGIGNFKLGDFGIARQLEKTTSGLSKKGTYTYMAPEVYKGMTYNSTVDIYSLGIVLYRFLNNNRAPFLPSYPNPIRYSDKERANVLRISGEPLPKPCNAEGRLAEIVLKACAYNPGDRYESAKDMKNALLSVLYSEQETSLIFPYGDELNIFLSSGSFFKGAEQASPQSIYEDEEEGTALLYTEETDLADVVEQITEEEDTCVISDEVTQFDDSHLCGDEEYTDLFDEDSEEGTALLDEEEGTTLLSDSDVSGITLSDSLCDDEGACILTEEKPVTESTIQSSVSEDSKMGIEVRSKRTEYTYVSTTTYVSPSTTNKVICSKCGAWVNGCASVCNVCGTSVKRKSSSSYIRESEVREIQGEKSKRVESVDQHRSRFCPTCGNRLTSIAVVCGVCGTTICDKTSTSESVYQTEWKEPVQQQSRAKETVIDNASSDTSHKITGYKICDNCGSRVSASSRVCNCCGQTFSHVRQYFCSEWKCPSCGRVNAEYVGTCACGKRKV